MHETELKGVPTRPRMAGSQGALVTRKDGICRGDPDKVRLPRLSSYSERGGDENSRSCRNASAEVAGKGKHLWSLMLRLSALLSSEYSLNINTSPIGKYHFSYSVYDLYSQRFLQHTYNHSCLFCSNGYLLQ